MPDRHGSGQALHFFRVHGIFMDVGFPWTGIFMDVEMLEVQQLNPQHGGSFRPTVLIGNPLSTRRLDVHSASSKRCCGKPHSDQYTNKSMSKGSIYMKWRLAKRPTSKCPNFCRTAPISDIKHLFWAPSSNFFAFFMSDGPKDCKTTGLSPFISVL